MTFGVIDCIFALVVLLGLIIGTFKGFYDLITKPIRFIAAICITFLLAAPVIDGWLSPYFSDVITDSITEALIEKCPELTTANTESIPFLFKTLAFFFRVDISGNALSIGENQTVAQALGTAIGTPVGHFVATVVAYLVLFVISLLLLKLIIDLLGKLLTAGPMRAIDKTLGAVLGTAAACLVCCIVATVVNAVAKDFDGGFLYDLLLSLNPFVTQNN